MYCSHGLEEGRLPQSGLSNFLKKRADARQLTRDKEQGLTLKPTINKRKSIPLRDATQAFAPIRSVHYPSKSPAFGNARAINNPPNKLRCLVMLV